MKASDLLSCRILFLVSLLCLVSSASRADTIEVTNTTDNDPGSLRQAILGASPGDTLLFNPGLNGDTIALTSGKLTLLTPLTIDASALSNGITVSGEGNFQVFSIGPVQVTIKNVDIVNGKAEDGIFGDGGVGGGGISNDGDLTLENCLVSGNESGRGGDSTNGAFALAGSGGEGGGIRNLGNLTLIGTRVVNNTTGDGGDADGDGTATDVLGGNAGLGGGIFNAGNLTIRNSTISNNLAGDGGTASNGSGLVEGRGGTGGGIYSVLQGGGDVIIENSTISGNATGESPTSDEAPGGGLAFVGGGDVSILNSTIAANPKGGGIFTTDATVGIVHTSIIGNTTEGDGGGIFQDTSNLVTIENSAIAKNMAVGAGNDVFGNLSEAGQNFVGDVIGGIGLGSPLTGDPLLDMLGDNGGPTDTILPQVGSPLIDMAVPSANTPSKDQRGFFRPPGNTPDIGATELGATLGPVLSDPNAPKRAKVVKSIKKTQKSIKRLKKRGKKAQVKKLSRKLKKLKKQLKALS